jgi:thioredoxin-like negative regulator of GroEL
MNTLKNIDEIKRLISDNKIVLLYLSSKNCNICKVIYPRLLGMLKTYPDVKTARADIQELPLLSGKYNVFTIPCVLIFADGKEIVREARYIDIEAIKEMLKRYCNMIY